MSRFLLDTRVSTARSGGKVSTCVDSVVRGDSAAVNNDGFDGKCRGSEATWLFDGGDLGPVIESALRVSREKLLLGFVLFTFWVGGEQWTVDK